MSQLHIQMLLQGDTRPRIDTTEVSRDTIILSLDTIRQFPSVNETVTGILASYDGQLRQETLQGKTSSRSGRYNNYDTVSTPPEIRWPNEGFHGSSGKKTLLYDDLSMPQWVAGQLTNILQRAICHGGDATQWAIYRLSVSQVSIINSHSTSQKKPCRYFNESTCSHGTHHGGYRHVCSFCLQQGRTSDYPESKCNFKKKKAD